MSVYLLLCTYVNRSWRAVKFLSLYIYLLPLLYCGDAFGRGDSQLLCYPVKEIGSYFYTNFVEFIEVGIYFIIVI